MNPNDDYDEITFWDARGNLVVTRSPRYSRPGSFVYGEPWEVDTGLADKDYPPNVGPDDDEQPNPDEDPAEYWHEKALNAISQTRVADDEIGRLEETIQQQGNALTALDQYITEMARLKLISGTHHGILLGLIRNGQNPIG